MKIIRWLLSHSFLILVIVAVIYGYMFWGNLAGKDTPVGKAIAYLSDEFVEVREFVDAVKAKQAKLAGEQPPAGSTQVNAVADNAGIASEQGNNIETTDSVVEQQPVSISYSHNSTRVEQNSAAVVESGADQPQAEDAMAESSYAGQGNDAAVVDDQIKGNNAQQAAAEVLAVNQAKEAFVTPDIEEQLSNVDESGKVINQSLDGNAVRETWVTARKAYYQRNYELSEQSYQKVIDSTVDNFDAYGELGNVFFNQGKNEEAASAYYEAAAIMVRKGQVNRAKSLMGLLRHLDKSKADELQKLIDSNLS
jgi:tetratricopeptide (TPR) repeat protein